LSTYAFQNLPSGRDGTQAAPPPASPPASGTSADGTAPQQQPQPPGGGMSMILIMALPLLLIFFTMRGQSKKQKQVEQNLKTGDTVVTQSGLIGKITEFVGESRVRVEIAPGVSVKMLKSAISGVDAGDKPAEGKDAKDKDAAKDKPQEKKA